MSNVLTSGRKREQVDEKEKMEKYNVWQIHDTDGGNEVYIVTNGFRKAIDLFERAYGYEPQVMTLCSERSLVIIQDLYEPCKSDLDKIKYGETK